MNPAQLILLASLILLSGCSAAVSEYISSQRSFGHEGLTTSSELENQGFSKATYCSDLYQVCMSYLTAEPLVDKKSLNYQVSLSGTGADDKIALDLKRNTIEAYRGEVVLIHGFRASKEFMVNSALYFRFLGFKVLVPDLLGHGESGGRLSFGIRDGEVLNELLNSHHATTHPLFIVGNSMGSITAVELARKRDDISGLILQAPMIVFDEAAANYANAYSPFLSLLLSDKSIRRGATQALQAAEVSLDQTDIRPAVSQSRIPVLILASSEDPVAPFSHFENLSNPSLSVHDIRGRSHPGMAVIGQQDNEDIQRWLKSTNGHAIHATKADNADDLNTMHSGQWHTQ
ncbi:alpha/beta hydrolase [Microbulbifer magnicolonia]|uniref:alpha/beta hydrolase n=1 Tax=Microbulbifer magnicolonia TaxID=3109744 RepID=UPI002B402704|nr:alpha/beta fold hydrolase [Microbulbifer sp. GG15]